MDDEDMRDFGTLRTEAIAEAGLIEIEAARGEGDRAAALARVIFATFVDYYTRSRRIPWLAKRAFETRDWPKAVALSRERIAIYSLAVRKAVDILGHTIRRREHVGGFWNTVEERYRLLVARRYEVDLAMAYLGSIRRWVYEDSWHPVEYPRRGADAPRPNPHFLRHLTAPGQMTAEIARALLTTPGLDADFTDLDGDAARVAARINEELEIGPDRPLGRIEVVDAGFYRNRGAYVVGALEVGGEMGPIALALLNGPDGVTVDAVILREVTLRHVFSSTLANFHVTVTEYHELVDYLAALMPSRPRGLHYSTVGYNHVGKLAVMEQISAGLDAANSGFDHAPGPRGSVAMGFTAGDMRYVLKVIRDTPTANYKWETFDGTEAVLKKYYDVHELNRSGSMLDNIVYRNISLPRSLFEPAFLEELARDAADTVRPDGSEVFFRHLIVQNRMMPVPLYLESCTREEAELVVIRLGQCIRNNAAIDVFNRDLDGRNYGVSPLRFVYLFDYDAVLPLRDVKVRTNLDREAGEEDIPDWFFEDGVIFLPEEMEAHLRLPDRELRRLFREAHGELLTRDYWVRMQGLLAEGRVPRVRTYPRSTQLHRERQTANLTLTPIDGA